MSITFSVYKRNATVILNLIAIKVVIRINVTPAPAKFKTYLRTQTEFICV